MNEELCGCCEGLEKLTPMTIANRPGLDALAYRVGTHTSFLETMKARLTDHFLEVRTNELDEDGRPKTARIRPLSGLTTRAGDDPAIALLDAWATVADVLTFYQERIANEGYLCTATELRSILELAGLVGHRLRPGVAASVYLAFTLEKGYQVEIPAGTRAQSLPGPGELPQPFETAEPLEACAVWNTIKPRLNKPQFIRRTTDTIHLKGVDTNLKPNDPLLVIDSFGESHFRRVFRTEINAEADRTKVILTIKGEIDLNLAELEMLIQPARIPEEEGPYSVVIGDRAAAEIRQAMENLLKLLRDEGQPPGVLKNAVRVQMPLLEQTVRVFTALNFDILADWVDKIRKQLHATLERLELRPEEPSAPESRPMKSDVVDKLREHLEQAPPSPSGKPFVKEIGERELEAVKASIETLILTLENDQIEDDEKILAVQAEILRLDQLQYVFAKLGFEALSPWVEHLYKVLSEAITDASIPLVIGSLPLISSIGTLATLLAPLLKPPSRPPVNALRLERTVARTFSPQADTAPRLLTTLRPALRPTLYQARRNVAAKPGPAKVYALRTTAPLFGHNVPRQVEYNLETGIPEVPELWQEWTPETDEQKNVVFLDKAYDEIMPGSYTVIQKPDDSPPRIYGNVGVIIRARTAYGLSGRTTEITLPGGKAWWTPNDDGREDFKFIRGTVVYAQSELLELAEEPIEAEVEGATIELDDLYDDLDTGRWLIVSGERTDIPGTSGIRASEVVMLAGATEDMQKIELADSTEIDLPGDRPHTTVHLANSLAYTYKLDTLTIYGNVVKATHGETREEVLGSGDGSKALQEFMLRQSPLTYVAAPTPAGAESTLEVRVNDLLWHEKNRLVGLGPNDRAYITHTDNEDQTTITFGDGQRGARLPTGAENVKAGYQTGIGKEGNVLAEQISLLATRPLGVKGVINPLPATGGADRESRDEARRNVPLAVMALDRLVSVQDYADFARTFAGIGKASAVHLSDGRRQLLHLTIASADDIPIDKTSDLYRNLRQALRRHGDPYQPIQVAVRDLMLLVISARVRLSPDYQWESVEPEIREALLAAFSFDRRGLGQDVLVSEVISTIQAVKGVAYVDVDILDKVEETTGPDELAQLASDLELQGRIVVQMDRMQTCQVVERASETLSTIATRCGITEEDLKQLNPDIDVIKVGDCLRIPCTIRPAQLAYLSPNVPDTLILAELTS